MGTPKRVYSSDLPGMIGQEAILRGWLLRRRDLGGIRFVLIRDKEGIFQATAVKKKTEASLFRAMDSIPPESVVEVKGMVKAMDQAPGGVEIVPTSMSVIVESETPLPLDVTGKVKADIDTRLDNRYKDYRFLQLWANDKLLWEEDIAPDRAGREWVSIDVTDAARAAPTLKLQFRVVDKRPVSDHLSVAFCGPARLREAAGAKPEGKKAGRESE